MPTLLETLEEETSKAIETVCGHAAPGIVKPAGEKKFGDYQANGIMAVAKSRKQNPRELADAVATVLVSDGRVPATCEIAGPGFINFHLDRKWLEKTLLETSKHEHLNVEKARTPETVVVDFSAPNVAKSMHVGHIRSTILGDALSRVLRFLGHTVITDNHLGDWGTQFGMLIVGYRSVLDKKAYEKDGLAEIERLYKEVQSKIKTDRGLADRARQELVRLQTGDKENLRLWNEFMDVSRDAFERIYERLNVEFDHWLGESFYNPLLKGVVTELQEKNLAIPSEGAICIFYQDDPELEKTPFLIQKQDGAFLYATTDLATIKYRAETFHPDRIVYVTDSRQKLHFRQLFAAAKRWGHKMVLDHVWFGTILGDNGKPIKTREGEPIKLSELLDEAEQRALTVVQSKNPSLPAAEQISVARVVGIGAVKYADLMQNRTADYRFSWDKLLALEGNTAPYLQYAYARIRSIFRRGGLVGWRPNQEMQVLLQEPEEQDLAKQMLRFNDVLLDVQRSNKPNLLANFLFELATQFNLFYQAHSVLKAPEESLETRLLLCDLTARHLQKGLELLGIKTPEAM